MAFCRGVLACLHILDMIFLIFEMSLAVLEGEEDNVPSVRRSDAIRLDDLTLADSLRAGGLNRRHVEGLAEVERDWPAILVWGPENAVIDGYHRVAAARSLGMKAIRVERFTGTAEQAFIEAVQRNVKHGLPLTVRDRVHAARRVLEHQPRWSDRRIAALCGLAPSTVSRVRSEAAAENLGAMQPPTRVGADGIVRPSSPGEARKRVVTALKKNPTASLRAIATIADVSHETVRAVRRSLYASTESSNEEATATRSHGAAKRNQASSAPIPIRPDAVLVGSPTPEESSSDSALSSCESAGHLLDWFATGSSVYEWPEYVNRVPLSRIYEVADESRRRADSWLNFAAHAGGPLGDTNGGRLPTTIPCRLLGSNSQGHAR